jgi:pyridoxamine 5'-phosphate oxidase
MRKEYNRQALNESHLDKDPLIQFDRWFKEAEQTGEEEPNAMILATSSAQNAPSARVVLLKEYSAEGFVFYTNYQSRKGKELAQNNQVALLFFWANTMRQIRIEGTATKTTPSESDGYFNTRPLASRASSSLSKQSSPLANKHEFENQIEELLKNPDTIKRPDHWGGFTVTPYRFEFWQGAFARTHDRFIYEIDKNNRWKITRLYP